MPLALEGRVPSLGAQQASWAPVEGANALRASPAPLVLEGPSACLSCSPPTSLLQPQDPHGPKGALEGGDPVWEPSRLPRAEWVGEMPTAPSPMVQSWRVPLPLTASPPLLPLLHPSYNPRTNAALRGPLRAYDLAQEPGRLPGPIGQGKC